MGTVFGRIHLPSLLVLIDPGVDKSPMFIHGRLTHLLGLSQAYGFQGGLKALPLPSDARLCSTQELVRRWFRGLGATADALKPLAINQTARTISWTASGSCMSMAVDDMESRRANTART